MKIIPKILLILFPIFSFAQENNVTSHITAITHVNVIDATGSPARSDMTIIIEGNRITTLDKTSKVKIPKTAFVINGSGKYLIPGLWDMHFHVFNNVSKTPPDENDFSLLIANGVVGIREMWTKMEGMPQVDLWRKQFHQQPGTLPRIGSVGTMIDGSPSQWLNSDTASSTDRARIMVKQMKDAGIDFVKPYNLLPREVYFAIADEAKKENLPVAGHIPNRILLKEAADAGQRSVEHLTGSRINFEADCSVFIKELETELPDSIAANSPFVPVMKQVLDLCDEKKALEIFQYLAQKNVWECPTMVLYKRSTIDSIKFFNDFRLKYISSRDRLAWGTSSEMKWFLEQRKDESRAYFQRVLAQIKLMKKAGIRFLAGTDYDNPYLYPGFSLHDELALFVEAGFTPMEALQTATVNPAKFLGTTDSLGTIEKGKIADMILLNADPLTDINNTKHIQAVFVNGKYLPKQTLEVMLVKVEQAVKKN